MLVAFSVSVTRLTFSPLVSPFKIFLAVFLTAGFFDQSSCHKIFQFLSFHHMAKKGCFTFTFLFMSDLVSASRTNVSCDFFAVRENHSSLRRSHISVASSFFRNLKFPSLASIHQNELNVALQASSYCRAENSPSKGGLLPNLSFPSA